MGFSHDQEASRTGSGVTPPLDYALIGYKIDHAYSMADRHAVDSDGWHHWMDAAKRFEQLARGDAS